MFPKFQVKQHSDWVRKGNGSRSSPLCETWFAGISRYKMRSTKGRMRLVPQNKGQQHAFCEIKSNIMQLHDAFFEKRTRSASFRETVNLRQNKGKWDEVLPCHPSKHYSPSVKQTDDVPRGSTNQSGPWQTVPQNMEGHETKFQNGLSRNTVSFSPSIAFVVVFAEIGELDEEPGCFLLPIVLHSQHSSVC